MSRLGDMMRLGAKKKPQAYNYWANMEGTCAIGAAIDGAYGLELAKNYVEMDELNAFCKELADAEFPELLQSFTAKQIHELFGDAGKKVTRPITHAETDRVSLKSFITCANDIAHYTREQIAELVDKLLDSRFVAPQLTGAEVVASILDQSAPLPQAIAGPELVQVILEATHGS